MKKHLLSLIIIAFSLGFNSCDSKLDLVPKGESTLNNIDDLALLLNQDYSLEVYPFADLGLICNESLGLMLSVPETLSSPNSLNYAYLAYDEGTDRITLCQNDARYSAIYKYINYCNTLLAKIDGLDGEQWLKNELKAKARILRAYFHWLCVNIHAQQYDKSSASELGGIPYVSDIDMTEVKQKLSLKETYERILEDCGDDVIENLPEENTNVIQADRAFGYAVRGKVLMQMKKYADAVPYFQKALDLNGGIEDRSKVKETGEWTLSRTAQENYVWIGAGPNVSPTMEVLSLESCAKFEGGDYLINYLGENGWDLGYGLMFSGVEGTRMYMGFGTCTNPYGISSDHTFYDLAECLIRTGEIRQGLDLADKVRHYRIENPTSFAKLFDLFNFDERGAMALLEPAKWIECLGGYENFFDCKRRNSEEKYKKEITRNLGEYGSYTLSFDSPLWILPFPGNATRHNPTLTQNF